MAEDDPARSYHEATKHSYESVRRDLRSLDWDRKPEPFKRYSAKTRSPLPRREGFPRVPTSEALGPSTSRETAAVTASDLASILWLGAGAHRRRNLGGDEVWFRTYASAGALYPNEVYAAVGDVGGLSVGLYHLDPTGPALILLRDEDPRPHLVRAAAELADVALAPVTLVITGILRRTAWKYGERGYRHLFWDAGMIVANLLAAASALGLASRVVTGFLDAEVETLLWLDPADEAPLCLVTLGSGGVVAPADAPAEPMDLEVETAGAATEFPAARGAHEAGRLRDARQVRAWRDAVPSSDGGSAREAVRPAATLKATAPIDRAILRRGSARAFVPSTMPLPVLAAILSPASVPPPTDGAPAPIDPFLAVHAVEDLAVGSYRFRDGAFHRLREGDVRRKTAFLCLEQALGGQGAATVFLLGDLDAALRAWGDRGYRAIQLAAGIAAGRMYLAAYALGWGATGLTFYDDEVARFFEPAAVGMEPLMAVAVGESAGRGDLRPVR